ncbi:alpha/beta hydrolase [Salinirussus salinus]|uniref:alpha/beta hydrolase n=1 Tax=Salinirussus salinus TaxID=1198300 RepID=UPI0013595053|nr:alpha/beta hydrolase [Salinirussus salinus]
MNSERLRIQGARELKATLDTPERGNTDAVVVACPPHPQMGGDRRDGRLRALGEELCERHVACLRVDYGPYDEGRAERRDVREALSWARERSDRAGLFGYSFGAGVGLLAAAEECEAGTAPVATSVLAPPASSGGESTVEAVDRVTSPLQVVYGERDGTVDWEPVVERARERDASVTGVPADHFFVGQQDRVARQVAEFLAAALGPETER